MRTMGMPSLSEGVFAALEETPKKCNAPESGGTDLQSKSGQVQCLQRLSKLKQNPVLRI